MLAALARSHEDFLTYAGDQLGESVFASAEHAELYRKIAEAHTESGTPPSLEEVEPPDDLPTFLQRLAELRRCRTAVALVMNFLAAPQLPGNKRDRALLRRGHVAGVGKRHQKLGQGLSGEGT